MATQPHRRRTNIRKVALRSILSALIVGVVGCRHLGSVSETGEPTTTNRNSRRNIREVRARVIGKTRAEVVRVLGTPDRIFGSGEREWWIYNDRFYDPITRLNLHQVTLIFRKGKLEDVSFD